MGAALATLRTLRAVGRSADPAFDRRLLRLAAMSVGAAVAELATLASLVPLLALVAQGQAVDPPLVGGQLPDEPGALVALFGVLVLVTALVRLALTAAIQRGVLAVGHAINSSIQRRLLDQPYLFHAATNSSRFVSALHKADEVALALLRPLLQGFAGLLIGSAILIFLVAAAGWAITLGAFVLLGAAYLALAALAGSRLVRRGRDAMQAYDDQVRLMMESSGAIRDILLDHRQPLFAAEFERASARMAAARAGSDLLAQAPRFLVEALGAIALAALAVTIAARDGGIGGSLAMFGLIALAMIRAIPLAQTAYSAWSRLAASRQAVADVAELLAMPDPPHREGAGVPMALGSALSVVNVSFRYPESRTPVLQGVDLTVERGEWIGLSGATGSGKSTLGDLMMGLLTPSTGEIRVDGMRLTPRTVPSWQRSIGHVSQSAYPIDDTIAANIVLTPGGRGADPERLAECIRVAQLEGWVAALEEGLDTRVGERGQRISGGQRQRIAIARALYKDASLLLLDEATNALDPSTEEALLSALRTERSALTVILISHRQTTLARCDRLIRLEDGRVIPAERSA